MYSSVIQENKIQKILLVTALGSILLSIWAAIGIDVINPDAICYLQSASTMSLGIKTATHVCSQAIWPFYSLLIFGFVKLTHLSYTTAAFALNGLFSLITVLMFVKIIHSVTLSTRVAWLAAVIILCAHEFNSIRTQIVRDHGFWAFYLVSIWFLLAYFRHYRLRDAVCWSSALVVATLFRIEGAVFLILIPLASLFDRDRFLTQRIIDFTKLNFLTLLMGVMLLLWLMIHPIDSLGRISELKFQLLHGVDAAIKSYNNTARMLTDHVLSVYSFKDVMLITGLLFIVWYMVGVAINISWIYAFLVVYAWVKRLLPQDKPLKWVLWSYISINVLITGVFLIDNTFLSKRYLIALSLTLMFWVPFALNDILQQWSRRRAMVLATVFFVVFFAVGGIFQFGYSKRYIREAGEWLAENTKQDAVIYSNDLLVMYYTQRFGNALFDKAKDYAKITKITHKKWRKYDYIALRVSKRSWLTEKNVKKIIPLSPTQQFANKRGDKVIIYQVKS